MRRSPFALLFAVIVLLALASAARAATSTTPAAARARVEHHLRHIERLLGHFETLLTTRCPRFQTPEAWGAYVDAETDRLVLLMAHLEQAWVEAKRTGDDDVRRAAKAPRRQTEQARQLVDKLQTCAELNGATFSPLLVWRRIEREVPRRQAEIALPD
jgi:hypothetical protein